MKTLIGSDIEIYLKSTDDNSVSDIGGILIDVTESELFVQHPDVGQSCVWVIPRDNIKYCKISSLPVGNKMITYNEPVQQQEKAIRGKDIQENCLNVFVNSALTASIPVPPTFNLSVWNDSIIRVMAGNPDVKAALSNKIQKSIDYFPGEVYICAEDEKEIVIEEASDEKENNFSMSMGKNITTEYLNPSEMVMRFNSFLKKDK